MERTKLKDVSPLTRQELLEFARIYYNCRENRAVSTPEEIGIIPPVESIDRLFATALEAVSDRGGRCAG